MVDQLLEILQHANQLKRTIRSGWAMRGVPNAESVAEHSYGVAFTAMTLAPYAAAPLDMGRLLALAVLHDLSEGLTTDIPSPVWRRLPEEIKPQVEQAAMDAIFAGSEQRDQIQALWEELQANETAEARLVHDADKLEMFLQAHHYQRQYGNALLDEFWSRPHRFHFAVAQEIYEALRARRDSREAPDATAKQPE